MAIRDSLGVPLEPEEPRVVAIDWKGDPLYEGEEVRVTYAGELISVDDIANWLDDISKLEVL